MYIFFKKYFNFQKIEMVFISKQITPYQAKQSKAKQSKQWKQKQTVKAKANQDPI